VDIDVDSDRNGTIDGTPKEEALEEVNPAQILPNCDDDNSDGVPDNWPGSYNKYWQQGFDPSDWDLDGSLDPQEAASRQVDAGSDKADLAGLWIHRIPVIPDCEVILQVTKHQSMTNRHWNTVDPQDTLRIFLSTDSITEPGNTIIRPGDQSIIGPECGAMVVFKTNPSPPDKDISLLQGDGIVKLGVEGIELSATVEVSMTLKVGGDVLGSDKVLMKVSPFELCDNTMQIRDVYVTNLGPSNQELRSVLASGIYGSMHESSGDRWHQDGYEIGHAGGMPVFLVSPRAYRDQADLAKFVHNQCLAPGIGVCWRLEGITWTNNTYDKFGNVECLPTSVGKNLIYGNGMSDGIVAFFEAQGVNPILPLDTGWLTIGHVDEVLSLSPGGVIMADPDIAWALLVLAVANGGQNASFAAGVQAADKLNGLLGDYNTYPGGRIQSALAQSRAQLGLGYPISEPAKFRSGVRQFPCNLLKAGAFVAQFPSGVKTRKYWVVFDRGNAEEFSVYCSDNGAPKPSTPDTDVYRAMLCSPPVSRASSGHIDADCIFTNAQCFILYWYWAFSGLPAIEPGDEFVFEVDAKCKTLGMPVLFENGTAISVNHVNSLVNSTRVVTGRTGEVNTGNVFQSYISSVFSIAGLSIDVADCMAYHPSGNIHCGTNAMR